MFRCIAISLVVLCLCGNVDARTRPRYGGVLRIETQRDHRPLDAELAAQPHTQERARRSVVHVDHEIRAAVGLERSVVAKRSRQLAPARRRIRGHRRGDRKRRLRRRGERAWTGAARTACRRSAAAAGGPTQAGAALVPRAWCACSGGVSPEATRRALTGVSHVRRRKCRSARPRRRREFRARCPVRAASRRRARGSLSRRG